MKFILKIVLVMLLAGYLVMVLGFTGKQYNSVPCSGIDIRVRDSLESGLVTTEDVRNLLNLEFPGITGTRISQIDMAGMEQSLNSFPAISDAQVFADVKGKLVFEISQRTPVVRVEDRNHRHYFLDAMGYVIPATMDYTPYILVANGNIPRKYRETYRLEDYGGDDQPDPSDRMMEGLLKISGFIQNDPFWRSQIVQLYVNEKNEFELIPRVGSQIILFGDASRLQYKFFKLETLYREGFSHTGWNQYEFINLKYNNQVICTKR